MSGLSIENNSIIDLAGGGGSRGGGGGKVSRLRNLTSASRSGTEGSGCDIDPNVMEASPVQLQLPHEQQQRVHSELDDNVGSGNLDLAPISPIGLMSPTRPQPRSRPANHAHAHRTRTAMVPSVAPGNISTEAAKAWNLYLRTNNSIITDLFAGQLQSIKQCLTCGHTGFQFDPYLDLSVPIPRPAQGGSGTGTTIPPVATTRSRFGRASAKATAPVELATCTLEDCLMKFFGT
jgi:hypothetical protein